MVKAQPFLKFTYKIDERQNVRERNADKHCMQRLAILDSGYPRGEGKAAVAGMAGQ